MNDFNVGKKVKDILKSKREISRLAEKSAEGIAINRKMNRFYDMLYQSFYTAEALTKKQFVNFGPGNFKHPFWTNIDKEYMHGTWGQQRKNDYVTNIDVVWDIFDQKPVPLASDTVEIIYSSHVIEHIWDEDAEFLFSEFSRILKKGGVLRLVTPDAELAVDAWLRDDWAYLAEYYWKINKKSTFAEYIEVAKHRSSFYFLDQFSLLATRENDLYIPPGECKSFLQNYDGAYEALTYASSMSSRKLNKEIGKHVNWFDESKLLKMLCHAGFNQVEVSGYGKSKQPILRDTRYFDKTDPSMSLYIEATL